MRNKKSPQFLTPAIRQAGRTVLSAFVLTFLALPSQAVTDDSWNRGSAEAGALVESLKSSAKVLAKAAASGTARSADADDRSWVVVQAPSARDRSRLASAGVAIESVEGARVLGVASPNAVMRLQSLGFPFKAYPLKASGAPPSDRPSVLDFPQEDKAYHDYARMAADLKQLAVPGLSSVFSVGQSLEGRDIWCLRINTDAEGQAPSKKPGIVFMGAHHAREHLSVETPLLLARYLIKNKDDKAVAPLLKSRDIYIIPMVNPDGAEYDIASGSYRMWRKNRRRNPGGSFGVDLNRNYGFHWGEGGASDDPTDETFKGPSAFSEPETRVVKSFVDARPNLKILLSYHTFSELILYPWGYTDDAIPDTKAVAAYKAMARKMAQWNGYTPEQASALYIAAGDTCDWAWGAHKVFAFTFELTPKSEWQGGFYPGAGAITVTFQKNLPPALYLIGLADDPYRAADGSRHPRKNGGRAALAAL